MARPELLPLLLLLLPLGWLGYRHWHWQRDAVARLGNARWRQLVRIGRTWLDGVTIRWLLASALGLIALAGPQWGQSTQHIETNSLQLMILLDVSRSMLAKDAPGSRLTQAKEIVETAVSALGDEDQVGLIAFAGETRLLLPLTSARSQVDAVLTSLSPTDFSVQGTVLGPALATAVQAFPYPRAGQPIILVVSDGEEYGGGSISEVQQAVASDALVVTVGVGTEAGALLLFQDADGQAILSRLNSEFLQEMARVGNGRYFPGTDTSAELPDYLQTIRQTYTGSRLVVEPAQRYQPFLLLALLLFCLNWFTFKLPKPVKIGSVVAGLMLVLGSLAACRSNELPQTIAQGNEAFAIAAYDQAINSYSEALAQQPQLAVARFNLGNAQYRVEEYQTAVTQLQQFPDDLPTDFKVNTYFNLGNSYFQLAEFDAAIAAYQATLRLNPDDLEAKHNLELALQMAAASEPTNAAHQGGQESQSEQKYAGEESSATQPIPTQSEPLTTQSTTPPFAAEEALRILHGMQANENFLPINLDTTMKRYIERSIQNDW